MTVFLGLALASVSVPRREPMEAVAAPVARGPDSYFHHVFDPQHLLGPVGDLDLRLDTFQRETTHAIIIAALPEAPPGDPDFTLHTAERWQVGARGADDGLVLFMFPRERRLRVEVGYGLEGVLPDARLRQILDESAIPGFRTGDFHAGLDAGLARLLEAIRSTPGSRPRFAGPGPVRFLRRVLADAPGVARQVLAGWRAETVGPRLLMSLAAVILAGGIALFAGQTILLLWSIVSLSIEAVRDRRVTPAREVAAALGLMVYRLGGAGALLLLVGLGGAYYFGDAGHFGGAGVEILW